MWSRPDTAQVGRLVFSTESEQPAASTMTAVIARSVPAILG
jgi:hypothetical protein